LDGRITGPQGTRSKSIAKAGHSKSKAKALVSKAKANNFGLHAKTDAKTSLAGLIIFKLK